jgi:hypothetical protein
MAFEVNREKLAWAAGLFEGEGCFSGQAHVNGVVGRRSVRAQVKMSDRDRVELFASIVDVGRVHACKPSPFASHKPVFQWRVTSFEEVQHVVAILWPWLGPRRRARAAEVLSGAWAKPANGRVLLSNADALRINDRLNAGGTDAEIAAEFGVSTGSIWWIRYGVTHRKALFQ